MTACVYRMFDDSGALLYVGITANPVRFDLHKSKSPWWLRVARIAIEHFPTREAAIAAETAAIQIERPSHNTQHATSSVQRASGGRSHPPFNRETLTSLRNARCMSMKELAVGVEISLSFVSEIESGKKNPSAPTIRRMAEVLEVDPRVLMVAAPAEVTS